MAACAEAFFSLTVAAVQRLSKALKPESFHLKRSFMTDLRCNLLRNSFICSFVSHFLFVFSVVRMGIFASVCK